ncbi:zinc finger protein 184-like [Dreissena polymorpha]|uniref:zinc finger protein 184-like n=1 Tax=Dreissena polymorpha TaxID=45954 RepID=UPI002265292D|nr:zinc finger protein 184-like [Dreissena polymorpha]
MDAKENDIEPQDMNDYNQSLRRIDGCPKEVIHQQSSTDSSSNQTVQCQTCSLCFRENEQFAFVQHMLIKHRGAVFPCPKCGDDISCLADYDKHGKCSATHRRFLCDLCDMTFTRKDTRNRHKTRKHDDSRTKKTITALSISTLRLEHDSESIQNATRMESKRVPVIKALAWRHNEPKTTLNTVPETELIEDNLMSGAKSSGRIPKLKTSKINLDSTMLDVPKSHVHVDCAELKFRAENEENVDNHTGPGDIDSALRSLHDICSSLEGSGCDVLVVTADSQRCRWFGTLTGKSFASERSQVLDHFFQFCNDPCRISVLDVTKNVSLRKDKRKSVATSSKKPKKVKTVDAHKQQEEAVVISEETISGETQSYQFTTEIQDIEGMNNIVNDYGYEMKQLNVMHENLTDTEATDFETADADDDYIDGTNSDFEDDIKTNKKRTKQPKKKTPINKIGTVKERENGRANFLLGIIADLQKFENGDLTNVARVIRQRFKSGQCNVYTVSDLDKGNYKCSKCGYNFLWQKHLDLHQHKYKDCQPDENFGPSRQNILKEEIQYCHEETGVVVTATLMDLLKTSKNDCICKICNKKMTTPFSLQKHIVSHNNNPVFKCNICRQTFTTDFLLSAHLKDHFLKPYECMNCDWRFDCEELLAKHQSGVTCNLDNAGIRELFENSSTVQNANTFQYKCPVCAKVMESLQLLGAHVNKQHPHEKCQFQCEICNTIVYDVHWYTKHMEQHQKKTFKCPFCDREFKSRQICSNHCRDHKTKMKMLICTVCGKTFNMKRKLDVHMRIHTGESPFACKVEGCNKAFRSAPLLEQHSWTHNSHSFICDICGQRYKNPKHLGHHRLSHTIQWRYQCTFCPEKYHTIFKFKGHLVHSHPEKKEEAEKIWGIKIYQCQFCNKLYHDGDKLKEHENRHRGVKPFECSKCGKCFVSRENHRVHVENHLGLRALKCSICSRRFKKQEFLQSHMKRVHSVQTETVDRTSEHTEDESPLNLTRRTSFEIMVNDSLQPLPAVPYVPRMDTSTMDEEKTMFVDTIQNHKDLNMLSVENASTALADVSAVCDLAWNS